MENPRINTLEDIAKCAKSSGNCWTVAVIVAEDSNTLDAINRATNEGFIFPLLIGDINKVKQLLPDSLKNNPEKYSIVDCKNPESAAKIGVSMVKSGEADIIMKGLINTDMFLKAIMNKEEGIMLPGGVLSYVCALELPKYQKLLFITDPAVIPYPNLKQKIEMISYARTMVNRLGDKKPKIALIGASEKASSHFTYSSDYQKMCEMAKEGYWGECIMDGPLDLFLACDKESVKIKGIDTPVDGDADILLFPSLESCNPFYKGLMLFGEGRLAGLIQGTSHPVIVMSRSETLESKYFCLALACLMANNNY